MEICCDCGAIMGRFLMGWGDGITIGSAASLGDFSIFNHPPVWADFGTFSAILR